MASQQSAQLAQFFANRRDLMNAPNLELPVIRAICESFTSASREPEGVSYVEVDAGGVPALWCIPAGCDEDSAVLYCHAGGTVVFSMNTDRKAGGHLAKAAGMRVLVLDFRLSPENKFPAQQDDVEAAYRWLISQGISPQRIISAGHSVGGNLAVNLAIRMRDQGMPMPAGILSISAWYDLELKSPTWETNAATDMTLSIPLAQLFRECWLGGTGTAHDDPRVNLLQADLAGLPPVCIHYGAHETLVGEILEFAERARTAGLEVDVNAVPEGQHLFLLGAGRVPETDAAIAAMGRWIQATVATD